MPETEYKCPKCGEIFRDRLPERCPVCQYTFVDEDRQPASPARGGEEGGEAETAL
jgi:transposase-like protein